MKKSTANIICRNKDNELQILLLKRAPNDTFCPSVYCLPGGGLEKDEQPIEGVKRETFEEAGIKWDDYDIVYNKEMKLKDIIIYYFISIIKDDVDSESFLLLDEKEHCNYDWCNSDKWLEMDLILDLKDHLKDIFEIDKIEKAVNNKHIKVGLDKNGHEYHRKVNDEETITGKSKVAESGEKPPLWMEKFKGLNLNKLPINIPEDKITITYKKGDDPNSKSLMHWKDPKTGRRQDSYTKEFLVRNSEVKWQRIANVNHKIIDTIKAKAIKGIKEGEDDKAKQSSAVILIISETGLRPGNMELFKITGNRGVTTLSPEDVDIKGDNVSFNFTGKSYKQNVSKIEDQPELAKLLKDLKKKNKDKEFLFDTDRHHVNDTFKNVFGFKGLKLKDMRTYVATAMARDILIDQTDDKFLDVIKNPKSNKQLKLFINKKLNEVYEAVSQKLNNTPAMAKSSYIHPNVKRDWLSLIGVSEETLMKSLIEAESIRELHADDLDSVIKKYPPSSDKINVNVDEKDEEECDIYLLEPWEENFDDDIQKYIDESIDINKSFLISDEKEKNRTIKEYEWYSKSEQFKKDLSHIPVNKLPISRIYDGVITVLSKAMDDEKSVVDMDSTLCLVMSKGENINTTTGEFCDWLRKSVAKNNDNDLGMPDVQKIVIKCNENPYLHFLAKGMDFGVFDNDFVKSNEIILPEIYDLLKSGGLCDNSFGLWNTDIEKAVKDLSKYKKVRKLVYRDGKSFITTVYVSNLKEIPDETIELESDHKVHEHAKSELKEGDKVTFIGKDKKLHSAVITTLKYHPVTDRFGTATIKADDGQTYSKSLKLIYTDKEPEVKEPIKSVALKFPNRLEDLNISKVTLGGSGDVRMAVDKDGKRWVLKKARLKGGVNENDQLKQSVLADKLYEGMGIDVPKSSYFQEKNVGYKISEFIPDAVTLGTISGDKKQMEMASDQLKKGFVMDCLLGNWDVIGASMDNIMISDGKVYRIDNDGSLEYRAKGAKKGALFSKDVSEIDSFLDSSKNPVTSTIYKGITDEEIKKQVKILEANKSKINHTIDDNLGGSTEIKRVINERIDYLKDRYFPAKLLSLKKMSNDKKLYSSKVTADYFKDWDKLEVEGNEGIKDAVKAQILKIEKNNKEKYEKFAKENRISVEEYKKRLQQHVEKLVLNSDFFRATDLKVLDKILNEDKRYKTQFEVETSGGCYSPGSRARTENKYFGFKNDIEHDVEKRPIYGYFSDNENGIINFKGEIPPPNSVHGYGEVTVKIKKEVALKKATVAFYDTLGYDDEIACTFASKPHFTSLFVGSRYRSPIDPLKSEKTSSYNHAYTEVQYHNQLKLEDMESVHYSPFSDYSSYSDAAGTVKSFEKLNKLIDITRKTHLPIKMFLHK